MPVIRVILILLAVAGVVSGQDIQQTQPVEQEATAGQVRQTDLTLRDFQDEMMNFLQRQFPRMPGLFPSAHYYRLPDYGPVVSITVQPPAFFFTRPMLLELERQQRIAQEQARRIRSQIDRAAQLIQLKARESDILQQIDLEYGTKKKPKARIAVLQKDLDEVRKSIQQMEETAGTGDVPEPADEQLHDLDLDKMIQDNYQELVDRVTQASRAALADKAPRLTELGQNERLTVAVHIRENMLRNRENTIVFSLPVSDIEAYRKGTLNLSQLQNRVQTLPSGE
jgi:hypothetical protein